MTAVKRRKCEGGCGRWLTAPESLAVGYGPDCLKKAAGEAPRPPLGDGEGAVGKSLACSHARASGGRSGLRGCTEVRGKDVLRRVGSSGVSDQLAQFDRDESGLRFAAPREEDALPQQSDRGDHVGDVGAGFRDRDVPTVIHAPMVPKRRVVQEVVLYNSRVSRENRRSIKWTDNQRWLLAAETGFACAYCQVKFGSVARRPGHQPIIVRMEIDHIRPFAFTGRDLDREDVVAACQICNGLKQDEIFDSIINARRYLDRLWVSAGYKIHFIPTRSHFEDPEGWAKEYARHMRAIGVRQDSE